MSLSVMSNPRLVELLVQRASEGLTSAERDELKQLLAQKPYEDAGRFEYTAAALLLAGEMDEDVLPQDLHDRVLAQAEELTATIPTTPVRTHRTQQQIISIAGRSRAGAARAPEAQSQSAPAARRPRPALRGMGPQVGWLAAAASLLVALVGWWPQSPETVEPQVVHAASLQQQRETLLARQDTLVSSWQPTQDPAATGVSGDVVWDPVSQQGYLRLRGLAANDVRQSQYQLWIFDATRDDAYPVDGGVFDIPLQGADEVIVPILAKLPVHEAAMFAVTIERPGGAVVSSRERLVLVAPVASS